MEVTTTLNNAEKDRSTVVHGRHLVNTDDHNLFSSGCLQACTRCWRLREEEQREGKRERMNGEQSWQGKTVCNTS